ncbi:MAG: DUF2169 domain-containing protein [Alcanivorax sp.]|nr:DUF2169 domain-containing protein [Alcanivorax sp.]
MLVLLNESPYAAGLYSGHTRDRRYQHTLVVKASFQFALDGNLALLPSQPPVVLADSHHDDATCSSLAQASEIAPFKQGAEFYLFGTAHAPTQTDISMHVSMSLQTAQQRCHKQLLVMGEHEWEKGLLGNRRGHAKPLGSLPLQYEYAYGGCHEDSEQLDDRNPAGRGFNPRGSGLHDRRAPRIEYPEQLALNPFKQVPPAGFGPLPVFWQPRRDRFGTPDKNPLNDSGCGWGTDARPNLHNAAPDDQQWPVPLTGGETLTLEGFFADHTKPVVITLPTLAPEIYLLASSQPGSQTERLSATVDTLVIDTDTRQLSLIARVGIARSPLANTAHIYLPDPDKKQEAQG